MIRAIYPMQKIRDYKQFFATFAGASPFAKNYIGIRAKDISDARQAMFDVFGKRWCFMYSTDNGELERQILDYNLKPLAFIKDGKQITKEQYYNDI